jgi:oligopeptide/dipeptide ABC transporter ATP-binding protein
MSSGGEPRNVLDVEGLAVGFPTDAGMVMAATNVSLQVKHGQTLGIVGESGSGKSVMLRALCDLVPEPGRVLRGRFEFDGTEFASSQDLGRLRGERIAMIFQDPASSLNPVFTVGAQIREVLQVKRGMGRREAREHAAELLDHVGIAEPRARLRAYAHELSGGMRQRVMIALAIASRPQLLLADEPTTALDVTTQAQILELLLQLQADFGMAIILVTHDLGVVAQVCDEVAVMYAGYIVERGDVRRVIEQPQHPYTRGLLAATPHLDSRQMPVAISGQPPDLAALPPGCPFAARCPEARDECASVEMIVETATWCACPFERGEAPVAAAGGGCSTSDGDGVPRPRSGPAAVS